MRATLHDGTWDLTPADRLLVEAKRWGSRLRFAVMLLFFRARGRFPRTTREISDDVVKIGVLTDMSGAYSDFTGAGAVIRKDVPAGALALSVAPQRNIEGWVEKNRAGTGAADAATRARSAE